MTQIHREQLTVLAEKAILVGVILPDQYVDEDDPLSELRELARTAGAQVVGELLQKRAIPSGNSYLGKGKVEELIGLSKSTKATVIIFDNDLTPAQIRNLEQTTRCKIVDRSELILDIFASRAATHEAKLQVEIAQLEYTYPRLRAMWDHLGQVVGGAPIGIGTRGPGEQQIEIDRRLVQKRLQTLQRELKEVQARKSREVANRNVDHFTVGLVGYTNAGKSTLFNRLTSGGAFAHSKLFATLSTRVERWDIGGGNFVLLSDTVGFIRNLPHRLVASFRSTLEETIYADLIVIVVDISDSHAEMQLETVNQTLNEIESSARQRIIVLNKIDQVRDNEILSQWKERIPNAILISAKTELNIDELRSAVFSEFLGSVRELDITIPASDSRAITFLEQRARVINRQYIDSNAIFKVQIGRRQIDQLLTQGSRIMINGMKPHEALKSVWDNGQPETERPIPPHHRPEIQQMNTPEHTS